MAIDVASLYERHAPEIHDFLARTVHDPGVAEDLTQNTFIRLIERGDTVREEEKLRPWLFTVAHNLAVTHVTRRRPADPIEAAFAIASGEKGPEEEAIASAAARLVWDAARCMEPRQYAVLDLTVRRGFSVAEVAEVLEISPAHAAVVVHRAREALGQAIRLLVVVRQRRHCARLAELVPEGTEVLSPTLRASVDRHMRRCEACKEVGERLTEPAELLAGLPLLPLPAALGAHALLGHGAATGAAASHAAGGAAGASHVAGGAARAARRLRHGLQQPVALAAAGAVALAGLGLGLGLHHGGPAPISPVHSGIGSGLQGTVAQPPLTGGPAPAKADQAQLARLTGDSSDATQVAAAPSTTAGSAGGTGSGAAPPPPPRSGGNNPTPPPPPPSPAPLIDLHPRAATPAGTAGGDVVVYQPPSPSTLDVILPGQPPVGPGPLP